ncbi:serine hydrolase domain-containing protein [Patiriisocius sp. Uisw_047]|jgi:CubicO group peptidase (beta-lactamase class C family)|uniref:serine hydrolase domain-containing protein n=1 Tax=Patiriisocius sp. Uisw_047 TaxID=3230969 RepID=UPI0039EBC18C
MGKPISIGNKQQINIILKKIIFIFFFFTSISNVYSQFEKIETFQKNLIEDEITASNVALVFKDSEILYHHIENSKNPNAKAIDNNTIFPIWSMSKPITIVAMLILHEKGLINFEDKVSKYIPEFENLKCKGDDGIYKCKKDLTLFHLMTHRSGYKYYGNPELFTSTLKYGNLKDFASDVANHPVEFEPGSKYEYGINMAILGRVAEVVSNKNFYEFLKFEIFDPLEMNETKFHLTESDRENFQALYINNETIKGFTNELDELTYDINNKAYFGGEGLVSTLNDYSSFCQMLLNGGTFKEQKIISQESIDMMTKPYSKDDDNGFEIGFSFFVLTDPDRDGTNSPKGIFGWAGYHNTHFWIDSENDLYGIFMTRARDFSFEISKDFRRAVYSSLKSEK